MGWGDLEDMEDRMGVMLGRDFEVLERLFVVADSSADSTAEPEDDSEGQRESGIKGKGKGETEERRAIEDVARLMARVRGKVPGFRVRS